MRKISIGGITGILLVLLVFPSFALTVRTGVGAPKLENWCQLDWKLGYIIGHGGVTDQGLLLSAAKVPPIPGYELNLRLVTYEKLLFFFDSPSPAGRILLYINEELVQMLYVPAEGPWWIELEDLPSTGLLRAELGPCTDSLLIRGVYYPCLVCPSCWPWFLVGAVVGAFLVWLVMR